MVLPISKGTIITLLSHINNLDSYPKKGIKVLRRDQNWPLVWYSYEFISRKIKDIWCRKREGGTYPLRVHLKNSLPCTEN